MRRTGAIFLTMLFWAACLPLAAQIDSTRLSALDARLGQYFSLLEGEGPEVKAEECDALISAATDPSLRQAIALRIYDHYKDSKLMGDESVVIHLTDRWFSSGEVAMRSERELFDAKMFADLNRNSLIGMQAPEMDLQSPFGETVRVPGEAETFSLLYFYDTDCAKCKLETPTLMSLLGDKDYPLTVYAVYVGAVEQNWKEWRDGHFRLDAGDTRIVHLWDPDGESDLVSKYGIVQTPRMFLIDPEGVIVGRGLDTESLEMLLDALLDDQEYSYGSKASEALFDRIFASYGKDLSPSSVSEVARLLEERTLSVGDTLSFKHLEGDLLYWLSSRRVEPLREGSTAFVNEYVLSRPEIWNTGEDSLMVVGMAKMLDGLLSKSPVGSKIPKMRIKGWNSFRKKGGLIFFHSEGCQTCREQMALADSLGLRYFSVNMDALEETSPRKAGKLLDAFDLSALPFIIETGEGGVVKRRYVTLSDPLFFFDEKE